MAIGYLSDDSGAGGSEEEGPRAILVMSLARAAMAPGVVGVKEARVGAAVGKCCSGVLQRWERRSKFWGVKEEKGLASLVCGDCEKASVLSVGSGLVQALRRLLLRSVSSSAKVSEAKKSGLPGRKEALEAVGGLGGCCQCCCCCGRLEPLAARRWVRSWGAIFFAGF